MHTPSAKEARSAGNARQRAEQRQWVASADIERDEEWYQREIQPRLAVFSLPAIAKATGTSTTAASQWRSGRRTPHRRHWASLAELVGADR